MTRPDPSDAARETFLRVALAPSSEGQLLRALEAQSHYLQRGNTWDGYEERLADLETLALFRTKDALDRGDHHEAAAELMALMRESGFEGNRESYEDVRNSFIDRVLETGRGIPITLSAVAIHLAEVAGVNLGGIGFPGHFLVGVDLDGPAPTIFDPFGGGQVLSFSELAALYTRATGRHLTAHAPMLRDALVPAPTRSILVRVSNNLRHHYLRRGSQDRAADVVSLLARLRPRELELRKLATAMGRRVETLN